MPIIVDEMEVQPSSDSAPKAGSAESTGPTPPKREATAPVSGVPLRRAEEKALRIFAH